MDPDTMWADWTQKDYPDNVIDQFAKAFAKVSPFDGPGTCIVSYSKHDVSAHCSSAMDLVPSVVVVLFTYSIIAAVFIALKRLCCGK